MTLEKLKFQFTCHFEGQLARAKERYEESKELCGVSCYASGYEMGIIDSLEDTLSYLLSMLEGQK